MKVEVCHARATGATRIPVVLEEGATLQDAVAASGIVSLLSLKMSGLTFAIFGRRAVGSAVLHDGDRVEILRALQIDPKQARHRRAEKKRALADAARRD